MASRQRSSRPCWRRRPLALAIALAGILSGHPGDGAAIESLRVLALYRDRAVVEIDGHQRLLRVGKPSPEGVVLRAADSESAIIEIEGRARRYRLGSAISNRYAPAPEGTTVRIYPDADGMYRVAGSIDGYPVRFLVDTGATLVAMSRREARRLGIDYRVEGSEGRTQTASGVVRAWTLTARRVSVGPITVPDVPIAVIDSDQPDDVLLGNAFLSRVAMRREGRVLELSARR